jgi:hypothetical protein
LEEEALTYGRLPVPEGLPVPVHDCYINHVGASVAMEVIAALDMVVDLLYDHLNVLIGSICIDDDASTCAMLKWSNDDYI